MDEFVKTWPVIVSSSAIIGSVMYIIKRFKPVEKKQDEHDKRLQAVETAVATHQVSFEHIVKSTDKMVELLESGQKENSEIMKMLIDKNKD